MSQPNSNPDKIVDKIKETIAHSGGVKKGERLVYFVLYIST